MDKYIDEVFGELIHDITFKKKYHINIFNQESTVDISTRAFEFSEITQYQRQTFIEFEKKKDEIIKAVEQAVIQYCKATYDVSNEDEIFPNVELETIVIHRDSEENKRKVGFIISDEYNMEEGIGIQIINEKIHDIHNQYLIL